MAIRSVCCPVEVTVTLYKPRCSAVLLHLIFLYCCLTVYFSQFYGILLNVAILAVVNFNYYVTVNRFCLVYACAGFFIPRIIPIHYFQFSFWLCDKNWVHTNFLAAHQKFQNRILHSLAYLTHIYFFMRAVPTLKLPMECHLTGLFIVR
jgi:hypothetical protein